MLAEILKQGQATNAKFEEINAKFTETDARFADQAVINQSFERQLSQISQQLAQRPVGRLPSQKEPNPLEHCKSVHRAPEAVIEINDEPTVQNKEVEDSTNIEVKPKEKESPET